MSESPNPATTLATVTALYDLVKQAATLLADDEPSEAEKEDHSAYAARLKTLVVVRADVPVEVARVVVGAIEEADTLPWSASWYAGKATTVFGLMRTATTYRDAAYHMGESVTTLSTLSLSEAAWFKASDTVFFASRYFDTTITMAKMARDE